MKSKQFKMQSFYKNVSLDMSNHEMIADIWFLIRIQTLKHVDCAAVARGIREIKAI